MNKFFLAAAGVLLSGGLFADTIGGGTGSLGAFTGPTGSTTGSVPTPAWNGNGGPISSPALFWNNPSDDAFMVSGGMLTLFSNNGIPPSTQAQHLSNIGYLLTDTGSFAGTAAILGSDSITGGTQYVGANGADPTSFSFARSATAENIALLFASSNENGVATYGTTTIGYYSGASCTAGANNIGCTNGTQLLGSVANAYTAAAGASELNQAFPTNGVLNNGYGFYAVVCYTAGVSTSCETYTSSGPNFLANGSSLGIPAADWDHFAVFQTAAGNWVVGFTSQAKRYGEGLGDFQDVVLELSNASIPEPGSIAILGLGLAGLGVLGRRRFAKK